MSALSGELRKRGYRVTVQREIILAALEQLEAAAGHVTAEAVYGRIRDQYPQVNISTVYRTLELVEEAGLITHTHFDDNVAKWHVSEKAEHQHLACRRCGAEQEVDPEIVAPLAAELDRRYGFQADLPHFAIVGLCRQCQQAVE